MRIVFLGSGDFALPTLHWLRGESGRDVAQVVSQPDRPSGRGLKSKPTPAAQAALELGLPTLRPPDVNAREVIAQVRDLRPDVGVVVAFGQKIGDELMAAAPAGFVNLHASLLPRYRGAAPYQWAVLNGDSVTGVTVFRITKRMDAGAILSMLETPIQPVETAGELHDRLALLGPTAIEEALKALERDPRHPGRPQDETLATKAPKLSKEAGRIDLTKPARELSCHIRGLWPWPGASCHFVSAKLDEPLPVVLVRARDVPDAGPTGPPGFLDQRLWMNAVDGLIEILEIQPAGKRVMSWRDFVNGRHVQPGDRLAP